MNNIFLKMGLVLVSVAIISGAVLAIVNSFAQPLIRANQEKKIREGVFAVLPAAKDFRRVEKGDRVYFEGQDSAGQPVGLAVVAEGNGWGNPITLMVGVDRDLKKLTGLVILDQRETPGLGDKISKAEFLDQFVARTFEPGLGLVRNEEPDESNEIEAITGATISSKAVVQIINGELEVLKELQKSGEIGSATAGEESDSGSD